MAKKQSQWITLGIVLLTGILLSCLLWVPDYLVNYTHATFWPTSTLPPAAIMGEIKQYFVRDNPDLFRVLGEFIVLWALLLLVPVGGKNKYVAWLPALFYLVAWIYQAYYAISINLYFEHPNLINDLSLIREVVPVFLGQVGLATWGNMIGFFLGLLLLILVFYASFRGWLHQIGQLKPGMRIGTATLLLASLGLLALAVDHYDNSTLVKPGYRSLQWLTPKLVRSLQPVDSLQISESELSKVRAYDKIQLANPPNIYLLFVESYGATTKCMEDVKPLYTELMQQYGQIYADSGYAVYSSYSEAPIMGGRSWLSFTTALTGLHIDNHLTFNGLLKSGYNFPHLVRYLEQEGYETYRIKTMANQNASTELSYSLADRFYAFDHWVKYGDIPYQGYLYDYFGGMPDQYALNYFDKNFLDKSHQPYLVFGINMTTHGPWHHVPPVLDDWKALDTIHTDPTGTDRKLDFAEESDRYFASVRYAIDVFTRFIFQTVPDHSLVLLVGDHQPPGMNYPCVGKITEAAVPIHVISKERRLVEGFSDYGFIPGMDVPLEHDVTMKHEGLYSMLVRELIRNYGPEGAVLPEYFPEGIK